MTCARHSRIRLAVAELERDKVLFLMWALALMLVSAFASSAWSDALSVRGDRGAILSPVLEQM